jgi:hypothetical protein
MCRDELDKRQWPSQGTVDARLVRAEPGGDDLPVIGSEHNATDRAWPVRATTRSKRSQYESAQPPGPHRPSSHEQFRDRIGCALICRRQRGTVRRHPLRREVRCWRPLQRDSAGRLPLSGHAGSRLRIRSCRCERVPPSHSYAEASISIGDQQCRERYVAGRWYLPSGGPDRRIFAHDA